MDLRSVQPNQILWDYPLKWYNIYWTNYLEILFTSLSLLYFLYTWTKYCKINIVIWNPLIWCGIVKLLYI
jgi:hypothetical protein